ncbi:MAG: hypothetical protein JWO03_1712 [Bacteroidetes bacterium]|nr:hypothetical protein [Bacteroidota bacterium]
MKKLIPFIGFICISASICLAQSNTTDKEAKLTKAEIEDFTDQASRVVWNLGRDITIIADKSQDSLKRRAAIKLACKLFINADSNIVQVSSVLPGIPIKFVPVRVYLNSLFDLPYSKVNIVWYHVYFSKLFEPGEGGLYYGIANISQTFTGYASKDIGTYHDVTEKKIKIVIEKIGEMDGDKEKQYWRLFLGDIQVTETKQ